jgi:PleD family two-component response regulator
VLPHIDADGALNVAEHLLEEVRGAGEVTASCGIALYGPDLPGTPDAVLAAADRAMYAAKQGGRDAVRLTPA